MGEIVEPAKLVYKLSFLDTQEQREDRYLRELRGLHESILQSFRPTEASLDAESV